MQKLSFSDFDQKCAGGREEGRKEGRERSYRRSTRVAGESFFDCQLLAKKLRVPSSQEMMPSERASEAFMMTFHRFSNQEKLIYRRRTTAIIVCEPLTYLFSIK